CRVYDAPLADAIEAADPLLDPQRIPRYLQIDDPACGCLQVEPLAADVGGQKYGRLSAEEPLDRLATLQIGQATVDDGEATDAAENAFDSLERVAEFGEEDERLARAIGHAANPRELRLAAHGRSRECAQPLEPGTFER